jgi:hypothetical protein
LVEPIRERNVKQIILIENQSLFADSCQNIVGFWNTSGRYEGSGVERRDEKITCICENEVLKIIVLKYSERKKWREELVCSKLFSMNIMLFVKKH